VPDLCPNECVREDVRGYVKKLVSVIETTYALKTFPWSLLNGVQSLQDIIQICIVAVSEKPCLGCRQNIELGRYPGPLESGSDYPYGHVGTAQVGQLARLEIKQILMGPFSYFKYRNKYLYF